MTPRIFMPGAGASANFWLPVAAELSQESENVFLSWPGLGNEPSVPGVDGIDDLVAMVLAKAARPCDLIAQSLGGVIAVRAALERPAMIRKLVLVATSGGVPVQGLGASDWRDDYYRTYPRAARWIGEVSDDLSDALRTIGIPTLLVWGENDPISPVAVGRHLLERLPDAELRIVRGGDHDLAQTHSKMVAELIEAHLRHPDSALGSSHFHVSQK
jgi:pimeloyl-ACP methyl ester carboxylesterase